MAKTPVNHSYKWCANCVWWAGERYLEPFFGWVEVTSLATKGKCMHRKGFYNLMMDCKATCGQFEKHPVIKN